MELLKELGAESFASIELVAEGLTSWVYKGKRHEAPGLGPQLRTIKILKDSSKVQQLEAHFRKLASIRSRHLPVIWGLHRVQGCLAVEMDWIEGVPLQVLLDGKRINMGLIHEVTAQLQIAIKELHDLDLVHGDLHAGNILVACDGTLRLIDFASQVDPTTSIEATPETMAPETWKSGLRVPGSDWFAVGLLYEDMLCWDSLNNRTIEQLRERAFDAISPESRWFKSEWEERGPEEHFSSDVRARKKLGELVSSVIRPPVSEIATQQVESGSTKNAIIKSIASCLQYCAGVFCLVVLPMMQTQGADSLRSFGQLQFRSQEWIRFVFRGQVHFAPALLRSVPTGVLQLSWKTKGRAGKVAVTIMPGQRTILIYSPTKGIEVAAVPANFHLKPLPYEKLSPSRGH